jgi:sulfotransferase
MEKKFYFLAGLPRSGNTLLASILNQNPDIYASALSPVADFLSTAQNIATNNLHINATMDLEGSHKILTKLADTYYEHIDKPIIIDREKTWGIPENFYNALTYINPEGKVIFTTRSMPEILASIITVMGTRINDQMNRDGWAWKSHLTENDNKCDYLMSPLWEMDKLLRTYTTMKNYPVHFHIVEYNDLITKPKETMKNLYAFLELDNYEHDFNNIKRVENYNEANIGMPDNLHEVRPQLNKTLLKIEDVLSEYAINKYNNY